MESVKKIKGACPRGEFGDTKNPQNRNTEKQQWNEIIFAADVAIVRVAFAAYCCWQIDKQLN